MDPLDTNTQPEGILLFDDGPKDEALENRFTYHAPNATQANFFPSVRDSLLATAKHIRDCTPFSREQSLALTALEEAMFWANAAIARNADKYPVPTPETP